MVEDKQRIADPTALVRQYRSAVEVEGEAWQRLSRVAEGSAEHTTLLRQWQHAARRCADIALELQEALRRSPERRGRSVR